MPSTYTSNTGIEKPGSGEQSGTWGTTTNTNFDIIDQALHGQASVSIVGDTDLTTNDGSTSNGANTVVILTGSPGSTFELRVTPTDQEKFYTIRNETNAACRVIYKGVTYSSSNGVEIASNATTAVTGDGGGASGVFKSLTPNADVVNDTTPQLGGNLDVQTYSIVSTSDQDINITPNGTGSVVLDGLSYPQADGTADQVIVTDGSGALSFADAASSLGASLQLTSNSNTWTIEVDGSNRLLFKYNGDVKMRVTSDGDLDVEDDITAYSGI